MRLDPTGAEKDSIVNVSHFGWEMVMIHDISIHDLWLC